MNSGLYLNKEIYEANVIRKCIIAFSRVAQISLVEMNNPELFMINHSIVAKTA